MRRSLLLVLALGCSAPAPAPTTAPPKWVAETAVPTAAPEVTPPSFRLPGDVRPNRYDLDLTIVPAEPTAKGKVHIDARVLRPTRVVWLHAQDLAIAKATLGGVPARVVQHGDFLGLVAAKELLKGELAIDIAFTTKIDKERSRGLYSENEKGADDSDDNAYAYTFFEPIDARRAFPCFDEPAYKVPWKLTFHIKKDHVALANAAVVRETAEDNEMKRVELAESKPLPSYLVAFIVGPFELVDGGIGGRAKTPIRFAIPKGRGGELGWARQVTPRVVAALESYFDMDYPFGKLDVAVVPRYWGTMEHPGLVAMGQPLTLIRPDQETRERKERYANILAHELGHYWFGDFVTMVWWDDTWLNEALGQWLDSIITHAVEPAWRYPEVRVELATSAMEADETLSTQSIRQPVTTNEGIAASFDGQITYSKGSQLFRMFEYFVGPPQWQGFIRDYLKQHAWGNASAEDFLGMAKAKLGPQVEAGIRSFLEQPGVPRISVTCKDRTLIVAQTRSLPAGTVDPKPKQWGVPVCMRYGDNARAFERCVQLGDEPGTVAVDSCPTWVIPNANANGYYRSVIDPAIAAQLLTPTTKVARAAKPTPAERMMIVADLRAAVERGELTLDKTLALVPVIAADPDDKVALSAFQAAAFHADALDDLLFAKARNFTLKSFAPAARSLGWKRGPKDSDERHERRTQLLAAVGGFDPALSKEAVKLADTWLAKRTGIDDELVPTVLGIAVQLGGARRFDQILEAARKPRDRTEQRRLLAALGASRDPALARRAFELVRGKEFDLRDSLAIVYGVLFARETRSVGLELVTAHLDELLARMRDDEASWFLSALASGSCEPGLRKQLGDLVLPRAAKVDGAKAPVDRGLEQADQCIAAFGRQLPALKQFLAKY